MTTYGAALRLATKRLSDSHLSNAEFEARLLLQHVSGIDRAGLMLAENDPISTHMAAQFDSLVNRRLAHEPVYRIIGRREFHGMEFALSPDTLEPRDDTEALVDAVLGEVSDKNASVRFADLGTGTGIVALTVLSELPNAHGVAMDISAGACATAYDNAKSLRLDDRLTVTVGDWFEPLSGVFDFIVSNPPYISTKTLDGLAPEVLNHDPRRALDGGADGLVAYRVLLAQGDEYLREDGFLALEIGYDQAEAVCQLAFERDWAFVTKLQDLGGQDRALVFRPARQNADPLRV